MKKISIIIPSFNGGRFIDKCLTSIIAQKGNFFKEYIVIDNCSTDETDQTINNYYQNIHYIREKDKGVMDAWRKGVEIADGDYIAFCNNSDHYLDTGWFSSCINLMEKQKWISAVYGMTLIRHEDGTFHGIGGQRAAETFGIIDYKQDKGIALQAFLKFGLTWNECTAVLSRKAVESLLPFNTTDPGATLECMRKFYQNGYLSYFQKRIATVTLIHDDSKTSNQTDDKDMWNKHWLELHKYRKDLLKYKYRNNRGEVVGEVSIL